MRAPLGLRRLLYRRPAGWEQLTFREKVAWRCRNPDPDVDYRQWVDKVLAKEKVKPHLRVAELIDVVETPGQIDCARLPPTYVMKATHSWNMAMLVREGRIEAENRSLEWAGQRADNDTLRAVARGWLAPRQNPTRHELQYRLLRPRILFEEFLFPIDYEMHFFMFHGVVRFTSVAKRAHFYHDRGSLFRFYDADWQRLEPGTCVGSSRFDTSPEDMPPPPESLLTFLRELCGHLDHVRVDLYMVAGEPYFSEFTFTHNAGGPSLLGQYESLLGSFWT